jgi:hypothetical protein
MMRVELIPQTVQEMLRLMNSGRVQEAGTIIRHAHGWKVETLMVGLMILSRIVATSILEDKYGFV